MHQILYLLCKLGNLQYTNEIITAIPSLLKFRQILYFIDFPIILGFLISKKIEIKKVKDFKKKPVIVMAIVIMVLCTYYHFIPESLELVTGFIYSKENSVKYGTIYGYHLVDVVNAVTNNKGTKYDSYDDMLVAYKEFKEKQDELARKDLTSYKFKGIASEKNVIVLQLESVQNFVVNKTINGKEITPNLNKFLKENVNIANMHSTSYTTTADSEHSVITSLYPLENGEAFSKYYGNTYDDIFKNFKDAGYYTMYAHGNYADFWNRKNVTSKLNIDETKFLEDFDDTSELIGTYLSDELLYKQTIEDFKVAVEKGKPVFYNIVAASSHKPFKLEGIKDKYSKVSIDIGDLKGTELGYYLEAINYTDYAFGIFIDLLKENNIYDDTVIVVFGDHYGMQMYDENLIKFLGYDKSNYNDARMQYEFSNVLCGMKIPEFENVKIESPVSKNDIKPTLAQLCGVEDTFSIGKSMFERDSYITINNGKIITREYLFDGGLWYRLDNGEKLDFNSLDEKTKERLIVYEEETIKELDISNSVIVNNLLQNNMN